MSQNMPSPTQVSNGSTPADAQTVQLALRLRAADRSDRAIVANVSAVHTGSGLVFIDFGFVEQQSIDEATRAVRSGHQSAGSIDGRLECRVAMGLGDIAQLTRQLQQVLASASRRQAPASGGMAATGPDPDASLQ